MIGLVQVCLEICVEASLNIWTACGNLWTSELHVEIMSRVSVLVKVSWENHRKHMAQEMDDGIGCWKKERNQSLKVSIKTRQWSWFLNNLWFSVYILYKYVVKSELIHIEYNWQNFTCELYLLCLVPVLPTALVVFNAMLPRNLVLLYDYVK